MFVNDKSRYSDSRTHASEFTRVCILSEKLINAEVMGFFLVTRYMYSRDRVKINDRKMNQLEWISNDSNQ